MRAVCGYQIVMNPQSRRNQQRLAVAVRRYNARQSRMIREVAKTVRNGCCLNQK